MQYLGRYEILEELGRGAMGTVYRARDPRLDRIVALKTITVAALSAPEEESYRQRFFREAQAAGKLSHPGIVTIHDVGEDESTHTPFIVMELIAGRTLEELGRGERLATETTLELIKQVADALDYAHGQHIIHRDIKPANIIVTPDGRAKITDFGIAKLPTTQLTQTGQVLGTPAYMSPEQLTRGTVDGRSDLFSLGVILYWLLTGDKPFTGDTTTAVSFKIVYQDPIPPTQLNPALSPDHDYVIERALAKDPSRRYQRGREVSDDLEDLNNGRSPRSRAAFAPVAAQERTLMAPAPPTASAETMALPESPLAAHGVAAGPPPRKKRIWPIVAAAAALFVLLLGTAGSWWWGAGRRADSSKGEAGRAPATREATTAAPPPRPRRTPSSSPTKTETKRAEREDKEEPPPWAPAVGRRKKPREAQGGTRSVQMATLRLRGEHNFDRATLYLYADGELLQRLRLSGKTIDRFGVTLGMGKISARVPVAAGEHTISIRIDAPRDDFDQIKYIQGRFRPGQARTLEIGVGKLGKWIGIGNLTRELTLRWVN